MQEMLSSFLERRHMSSFTWSQYKTRRGSIFSKHWSLSTPKTQSTSDKRHLFDIVLNNIKVSLTVVS